MLLLLTLETGKQLQWLAGLILRVDLGKQDKKIR
jgi:hypothetical protein